MHPGWPITPVQKRSVATSFYFWGHPSRAENCYDTTDQPGESEIWVEEGNVVNVDPFSSINNASPQKNIENIIIRLGEPIKDSFYSQMFVHLFTW